MRSTFEGQLEIDHDRGVIYFHNDGGGTLLRINRLNSIPHNVGFIDLSNVEHQSYIPEVKRDHDYWEKR